MKHWFSNFKIQNKLIIGFSYVIVLSVILGNKTVTINLDKDVQICTAV